MKYYIVDAFSDSLFQGNPAGVCLPGHWPDDALMQQIAFENNLAETAFMVPAENGWRLRWFTPEVEMDLCGHATLAGAYVLAECEGLPDSDFSFETRSGLLRVHRDGDVYTMDFPSRPAQPCPVPEGLEQALGISVGQTWLARDLLVLLDTQEQVASLTPDFSLLGKLDGAFALIVTAKGDGCDFVSRFFAPGAGINEDPVTGSSHCTLIPFWRERLGKTQMTARQLSRRGGTIYCRDCGDRVEIGGQARLYLSGMIHAGM